MKAPDESTIPLCGWDHQHAPDSYHKTTPEHRWEALHGIDVKALVTRLNHCWNLITRKEPTVE